MIEKCENCEHFTGTLCKQNGRDRTPDEWCPMWSEVKFVIKCECEADED